MPLLIFVYSLMSADMQIWALLTRRQCRVSDTQPTVQDLWPLVWNHPRKISVEHVKKNNGRDKSWIYCTTEKTPTIMSIIILRSYFLFESTLIYKKKKVYKYMVLKKKSLKPKSQHVLKIRYTSWLLGIKAVDHTASILSWFFLTGTG